MNFSFELSGALLTGNINPDAMMGMSAFAGLFFGGMAMIRIGLATAIVVLMIISRWRVFEKAGLPGWGIFIPFYNRYLMFQLGGWSGRNFLWIFIPPVFGILMIINYFRIAKNFGKHRTFGLGLRFLRVIFIPILAFDNSIFLSKKAVKKVIYEPVMPVKTPIKKAPSKKTAPKKVKTLSKKK